MKIIKLKIVSMASYALALSLLISLRGIAFAEEYPTRPEEVLKKYFYYVNKDAACSATQYLMPETLAYQKRTLTQSYDSIYAGSKKPRGENLKLEKSWQEVKLLDADQFICAIFKNVPIQEDVGLRFSHYEVNYISKTEVKIKYDFQYVGPNGRDQATARPAIAQQERMFYVNGKWLIQLDEI